MKIRSALFVLAGFGALAANPSHAQYRPAAESPIAKQTSMTSSATLGRRGSVGGPATKAGGVSGLPKKTGGIDGTAKPRF